MKLLNSVSSVTISYISELEKKLKIKFPNEFKNFIVENNGGIPEQDMLFDFYDEVSETENTSVIRRFFSIYDDERDENRYDLVKIYKTMVIEKAISDRLIPIADDPAGNPICLSISEKDFGVVYYLNHEFEDVDTGFLIQSKISDDFSQFLKDLYEDE